ncbi:MAG: MRP family ATP-binding protein [Planctomycetota bacterium]|nr:MAG: MRP family ATP-binding protein [Planctomycetota bacterium]
MLSESSVQAAVSGVRDPEIGRSLGELKMVRSVQVSGTAVRIGIELPTPAYPGRERITAAIRQVMTPQGASSVEVEYTWTVQGKGTGGAIGLNVKNVIAVGSGKGGVGKSTVAASLALGLKHFGAKVGLMDADVYGPSIPHLVGATGTPVIKQIPLEDGRVMERIVPIDVDGMPTISMGYMVKADQAVIWRGPMLHKALSQFLQQTDWGTLDYLVIDMPPGTGDVALTLSQMVGLAGAVVVCTPQQVALLDAVKAVSMFKTVKIPILGMVENMTGEIFGRGGAKAKAAELGLPFLGEVPANALIREQGDAGQMAQLFSQDNPSRAALLHMCERVAMEVARSLLETPSLPTLEIL